LLKLKIGLSEKILDEFKNWTWTEMETNSKVQTLMEKAAYLEYHMNDMFENADCRKSREVLQPVPFTTLAAVESRPLPDRFWDGFSFLIDFYLSNCGAKRTGVLKHKLNKFRGMLEKSCKHSACSSFFPNAKNFLSQFEKLKRVNPHEARMVKFGLRTFDKQAYQKQLSWFG